LAVRRLSPNAKLVEHEGEIADALLVARFTLQFLEAQPDKGIACGLNRQRADALVHGRKDVVGVLVQVASARNAGHRREQDRGRAILPEHLRPQRIAVSSLYLEMPAAPNTVAAPPLYFVVGQMVL